MMEKTARVGCEQAEQLATSVVAAAAAAAAATASVDPSASATACSPYDSVKRAVRCNQLAISASGCLTALAAMAATVGQLVRGALASLGSGLAVRVTAVLVLICCVDIVLGHWTGLGLGLG